MKNKLITLILLIFSLQLSFSQESNEQTIDTVTIAGQHYFVYPFGEELMFHNNLWRVIRYHRGENQRKSFKEWYILENGEDYDKKEFRRARREAYLSIFQNIKYAKRYKHLRKPSVKKAIRKNPYPLMEPKYTLENDVIPSLDPIPNGKYVLFFTNYISLDKKGFMEEYDGQKVAAFFSIMVDLKKARK
ncbi:MAG: hypothetical protein LW688_10490 [Cryomorphaceae bacterium]|nr:hypothetical protein [Cryomorphaceae bacterium]